MIELAIEQELPFTRRRMILDLRELERVSTLHRRHAARPARHPWARNRAESPSLSDSLNHPPGAFSRFSADRLRGRR